MDDGAGGTALEAVVHEQEAGAAFGAGDFEDFAEGGANFRVWIADFGVGGEEADGFFVERGRGGEGRG